MKKNQRFMKTMQNNQRRILMLLFFSFMVSHFSISQVEEQIPIMAWGGIPPEESTVERFIELRESGITHNLSHGYKNADELAVAMDAAAKAGIKMLVCCPELKTETEKTVKRFMNHPAIAGYDLRDEPRRKDFPELGEWVRKIQAIDNKNFCYVNLLPNQAGKDWWGTDTYLEHVQLFISEVPVPILSFDHYPLILDQAENRVIRREWYDNLETFSNEARKAGKPFWAFALTSAHKNGLTMYYPIPTLAELKLQVFSNLAYGAQGIQYFTYWTPMSSRNTFYDFHHGPIDFYSKKRTEIYDYIKEINSEIKKLSGVFLHAKVVSVAHTGETIPMNTNRLIKLPDIIKTFETEGTGAIVSVLQKEEKSYLVVVNRDFKNNMKVRIEGESGLLRVLKDGSMVPASDYISAMNVAPGDILIYCWNNQ